MDRDKMTLPFDRRKFQKQPMAKVNKNVGIRKSSTRYISYIGFPERKRLQPRTLTRPRTMHNDLAENILNDSAENISRQLSCMTKGRIVCDNFSVSPSEKIDLLWV